jgi:hypothetical protein
MWEEFQRKMVRMSEVEEMKKRRRSREKKKSWEEARKV